MSEPVRESIPTSADPRSRRTTKKARITGPAAKTADQAASIDALFAHPERAATLPAGASSGLSAPPELVANVQGSSAGAGSGEFHVYKASRRREYERMRAMEEQVRREGDRVAWERDQAARALKDDEKTRKNRAKRSKKLKAKGSGYVPKETIVPSVPEPESKPDVEREQEAEPEKEAREPKEPVEKSTEPAPPAIIDEVGLTIHDDD